MSYLVSFCSCVFQSFKHCDYLAWGRERELILVLFVRLFDLCLFGFVGFLFLLVSVKSCGLWYWHSLDFSFSLTFFLHTFTSSKMDLLKKGARKRVKGMNSIPNLSTTFYENEILTEPAKLHLSPLLFIPLIDMMIARKDQSLGT